LSERTCAARVIGFCLFACQHRIINGLSVHVEQSYSPDGGRTWELNWVATDTRVSHATDPGPK
jgi:hypothetical protein